MSQYNIVREDACEDRVVGSPRRSAGFPIDSAHRSQNCRRNNGFRDRVTLERSRCVSKGLRISSIAMAASLLTCLQGAAMPTSVETCGAGDL